MFEEQTQLTHFRSSYILFTCLDFAQESSICSLQMAEWNEESNLTVWDGWVLVRGKKGGG